MGQELDLEIPEAKPLTASPAHAQPGHRADVPHVLVAGWKDAYKHHGEHLLHGSPLGGLTNRYAICCCC